MSKPERAKKTAKRRSKWDNIAVRKPRKGSKAESVLTLASTTPATPPQIAETLNMSLQGVHYALRRYGIEPKSLNIFKEHRADLLAAAGMKDLECYLALDDEERKGRIKSRGLVDFGIVYDKERLERDQTTENIGIVGKLIREIRDESD